MYENCALFVYCVNKFVNTWKKITAKVQQIMWKQLQRNRNGGMTNRDTRKTMKMSRTKICSACKTKNITLNMNYTINILIMFLLVKLWKKNPMIANNFFFKFIVKKFKKNLSEIMTETITGTCIETITEIIM